MQYERITPKSYPVNLIDKNWAERKLCFRSPAKSFPEMIHNMEVLEDDVWVITNPKSGTTWMQELLWLLLNDCNFEAALSKDLELRSPFLEYDFIIHTDEQRALKPVQELPSPRLIKSHLPLPLLPAQLWQKKAKVVYVFRNPKDAWVSAYYHGVTIGFNYGSTLEQFVNACLDGENIKLESIEHAAEFYQLRNEPWVYYTSFERMKLDLRAVIEDLCKFLDKTVTEQQMERLLKHLSFEEMKKNPTTNHNWESADFKHENARKTIYNFVRSGKVNGYKDELTTEQIERADRLIEQRLQSNKVTLEELLLLDDLR
ncbi:amine sulfotransferase-like [Drosophila montana]|uniref:amine sulfotransferase-like n=1 Tax=Drosophila montana TaxID=40370 RepID=UPI00313B977D